ncbi:MAG: hypothetical protein UE068_00330, partial [Paludibacteraceae bacterium]|nr:hypothetical protein [Paludibacteraceae bacterium]
NNIRKYSLIFKEVNQFVYVHQNRYKNLTNKFNNTNPVKVKQQIYYYKYYYKTYQIHEHS